MCGLRTPTFALARPLITPTALTLRLPRAQGILTPGTMKTYHKGMWLRAKRELGLLPPASTKPPYEQQPRRKPGKRKKR